MTAQTTEPKARTAHTFGKSLRAALLPVWTVAITCLFKCVFLYTHNVKEADFADVIPGMALALLFGALALGIGWLLLRNLPKAAIAVSFSMLLMMNVSYIGQLIKMGWKSYHDAYLLVVFCLLIAGVLRLLYKKSFDARPVCRIITIAFTAMTLVSIATAAPEIVEKMKYSGKQPVSEELQSVQFAAQERPNVYFFLFDEYAGFENLEYYYDGFDNAEFSDFLRENGFSVSHSTRNTESVFTDTILPNLLNLSYVVEDEEPAYAKKAYLQDPALFEIFANNGYRIDLICQDAWIGSSKTSLQYETYQTTLSDWIVNHSALDALGLSTRLLNLLRKNQHTNYVAGMRFLFHVMEGMADDCAAQGPTFSFCYLKCPHSPLVFREDGSVNPEGKQKDWKDKSVYLGQLKYLNTRIETAVRNILEKDPTAIIILQSDHGERQLFHLTKHQIGSGGSWDYEKETYYMQNALNAVYCGGKALQIEGMSGINTLRYVLNTCFGTELAMLPSPEGYVYQP